MAKLIYHVTYKNSPCQAECWMAYCAEGASEMADAGCLVTTAKRSPYPTTPTKSSFSSVTHTCVDRWDNICAITAASELVTLQVRGALLPRYTFLPKLELDEMLKKPMLLLLNRLSLVGLAELVSPMVLLTAISEWPPEVGLSNLSSTPITNCPADKFARAHAAAK